MMKTIIAMVLFSCLICSCSNNSRNEKATNEQNATPAILDESNKKRIDISKRYNANIIEDLFEEASKKDTNLNKLIIRISEIERTKNDSLETYNRYIHINDNYWNYFDTYINQINDSVTKKEFKLILSKLKLGYQSHITNHKKSIEALNNKVANLHDYEIIMKLIVTHSMMENFQNNELPKIDKINNLIIDYDKLLKDIEPYTIINK